MKDLNTNEVFTLRGPFFFAEGSIDPEYKFSKIKSFRFNKKAFGINEFPVIFLKFKKKKPVICEVNRNELSALWLWFELTRSEEIHFDLIFNTLPQEFIENIDLKGIKRHTKSQLSILSDSEDELNHDEINCEDDSISKPKGFFSNLFGRSKKSIGGSYSLEDFHNDDKKCS